MDGEGKLHAINFRGVDEPLHVFAQAENGGALLRFITANALEKRGAVTHDVRKHVKFGVVPIDPFTVVPNFFLPLNGHKSSLLRSATPVPAALNYNIHHT